MADGAAPTTHTFARHDPTTSVLFGAVRAHLATFAAAMREAGAALPGYVDSHTARRRAGQGIVTRPPDSDPEVLDALRVVLCRTDWVVYAKAPFGGAEQVYAYLGRYTHRVGISNARLPAVDDRGVTLATKGGGRCTLAGVDFLRRFVDHVLPKGFTRIRHCGLLAPSHATTTLERARVLLTPTTSPTPTTPTTMACSNRSPTWIERLLTLTGVDARRCPRCETGHLVRQPLSDVPSPTGWDTS